jgi:G3E family GTPase
MSRVPVTVLTGFLGAGKTTLLRSLLTQADGRRIAVIVNEFGDAGFDGGLVEECAAKACAPGDIVELTNGCICCTLREDLLLEVAQLARSNRFDYLVIESTGISEPLPVAETFTFAGDDGRSLGDLARLDTMATVIDGGAFLRDLGSVDDLRDRGESLGTDDERTVVDLLVDQVEFADVLIVNKTDLLNPAELERLEALLRRLNPGARVLHAEHGRVSPDALIATGAFDFDRASEAPGWLAALRGEESSEADEYGFTSFVYRRTRPFHPERLWETANGAFTDVIRSKGFFWIASRPAIAGEWSTAGGVIHVGPAGAWWAAVPPEEWPTDPEAVADIAARLHTGPWGDRRQELVFIGIDLDEAALTARLDACLLTDTELATGLETWSDLPDPWPAWYQDTSLVG